MILQNLANIGMVDIIIIICHSAVVAAYLLSGIYLFFKLRNKPPEIRNYLLGISLFFILYGASRVTMFFFELLFDPFVWQIDVNEINQLLKDSASLNLIHDIVWRTSTALGVIGISFLMYELELRILNKKTKFFFTILTILTVIPALLFGVAGKDEVTIVRIILYVGNFLVIVIPIFYFHFARITTGDTRKRAIGAGIGITIMFLAVMFNSSAGKTVMFNSLGMPGMYIVYYMYGILAPVGVIIYMKSIQY
jgi:hypothetical protein